MTAAVSEGVILDSCIWVALAANTLERQTVIDLAGAAPVFISVISLGELGFGVHACADPVERAGRAAYLQQLERRPILDVSRHTAAALVYSPPPSNSRAVRHGRGTTTCGSQRKRSNTATR